MAERSRLGAWTDAAGTHFAVWSDQARRIVVRWTHARLGTHGELELATEPSEAQLFRGLVPGLPAGARYDVWVDDTRAVDPYAHSLPDGVHGQAEVIAGPPPQIHPKRRIDLDAGEVIYELHVGTFTEQGTYRAVAEHLPELVELGISVIELMPIASFAGQRGWGYDGVALFAPFAPYGTLDDLCALLDAAHGHGLGVILDVVYNHLGPDGNYLNVFSDAYFDRERHNPWGRAPALDKPPFRHLVLENVRYWLHEVGFDGLRLDAVHELEPGGSPHLLQEVSQIAHACEPAAVLIAEDDRNDPGALLELGLDAVWSDDFHHSAHVLLTSQSDGYYGSYQGTLDELQRVIVRGQLYEGQVFPSSGRARGKPSSEVSRARFVYALQNHDQVGNRACGERLHALCDDEMLRAITLLWLFLPATPLLFMGQEWAASSPFLYFSDHSGELGEKVTAGRRAEFGHFAAFSAQGELVPDPQASSTFERSKLRWEERRSGPGSMLELYRRALALRRDDPALRGLRQIAAAVSGELLWVRSQHASGARLLLLNCARNALALSSVAEVPAASATLLLSSSAAGCGHTFELPGSSCSIFAI